MAVEDEQDRAAPVVSQSPRAALLVDHFDVRGGVARLHAHGIASPCWTVIEGGEIAIVPSLQLDSVVSGPTVAGDCGRSREIVEEPSQPGGRWGLFASPGGQPLSDASPVIVVSLRMRPSDKEPADAGLL